MWESSGVAMEHLQGAASLAAHIKVPIEDLLLPCVFCGRFLDFHELTAFDYKQLQLTWKGGFPRGCCIPCAKTVSEQECMLFTEVVLTSEEFANQVGGFASIFVRCRLCLKLLSLTEKVNAILHGEQFLRVRGRWRARCRCCINI
ncbi:E6 [Canis familiaris papillomavirus 8]|uniref:Protein E6 n=1 Tax=Canis familiaris papillomavirus 8 TaxID=1081055 RepID=G3DRD7_9PAPI|nr:E6 [Canis familiaris papillomavirus 8]AEO16195.1 E6 [Canis familiaris papillomavirus 8]